MGRRYPAERPEDSDKKRTDPFFGSLEGSSGSVKAKLTVTPAWMGESTAETWTTLWKLGSVLRAIHKDRDAEGIVGIGLKLAGGLSDKIHDRRANGRKKI